MWPLSGCSMCATTPLPTCNNAESNKTNALLNPLLLAFEPKPTFGSKLEKEAYLWLNSLCG